MEGLNKFKKTALFLNASSSRMANFLGWKDAFYDDREFSSLLFNWCLEFALFNMLGINTGKFPLGFIGFLVLAPFLIHLSINIIFKVELRAIEKEYDNIYGKTSYIIYVILAILGIILAFYYLFFKILS